MSVRLVKKGGGPREVSKHLDSARPKYSAAVASIAALVDKLDHPPTNKKSILRVLVSNLDDACREAANELPWESMGR